MKYTGPLGLPRLTNIGPLSAEQLPPNKTRDEIEEVVEEVAEEQDIDFDDLEKEDVKLMHNELASKFFRNGDPDDSPSESNRKELFQTCMESKWANNWESGTQGVETTKEEIITKADACYSAVADADSGFSILPFTGNGSPFAENE